MLKTISLIASTLLVTVAFTACEEGTKGTKEPELLLTNQTISVAEDTNTSFDLSKHFANVSSYKISSSLNTTLDQNNLTIISSNVDTTTEYIVSIVASDDNNNSVNSNITIEVVDEQDDQAITLSDITIAEYVSYGRDLSLSLTATDSDDMESVTSEVKDSNGYVIYRRISYSDTDSTKISVNESFSNLEIGTYSLVITALGADSGEGDRSLISQTHSFSVGLDTPEQFDFKDQSNLSLNSTLRTNTYTVSGQLATILYTTTNGTLVVNGKNRGTSYSLINGDTLAVDVTSSSSYSTSITTMVSANGVSDIFVFSTQSDPSVYTPPSATPPSPPSL